MIRERSDLRVRFAGVIWLAHIGVDFTEASCASLTALFSARGVSLKTLPLANQQRGSAAATRRSGERTVC